jgi:hypothetical protein
VKPNVQLPAVTAKFGIRSNKRDGWFKQNGYILACPAFEDTVLVMGGMFQQVFVHSTISHRDILREAHQVFDTSVVEVRQRNEKLLDSYRKREKFCSEATPRMVCP